MISLAKICKIRLQIKIGSLQLHWLLEVNHKRQGLESDYLVSIVNNHWQQTDKHLWMYKMVCRLTNTWNNEVVIVICFRLTTDNVVIVHDPGIKTTNEVTTKVLDFCFSDAESQFKDHLAILRCFWEWRLQKRWVIKIITIKIESSALSI